MQGYVSVTESLPYVYGSYAICFAALFLLLAKTWLRYLHIKKLAAQVEAPKTS
jgi:Heme exporter protein D (CcmD)